MELVVYHFYDMSLVLLRLTLELSLDELCNAAELDILEHQQLHRFDWKNCNCEVFKEACEEINWETKLMMKK